jgi:UDP-GlcNAc:undecaprenyl-phosphate GlcNAc-1-phosphate transferase
MLKTIIFGGWVAFEATIAIALLLIPLASRLGLVDRPGALKKHIAATPAVGGLAILLAVAGSCVLVVQPSRQLLGLGAAAVVIVVFGVVDDATRLRWPFRLGAQVLATLIMVGLGGVQVEDVGAVFGVSIQHLGPLSVPITVLATVGIINAINMIDGVDGLAGSVSLVAIAMLAGVAAYAGNNVLAEELCLVAGALCGFLVFNLRSPWRPRAAIFLGNAGSELLGLLIACASIRLTQNAHHPVGAQLAPFLIAPALIDCLTLILRRIRSGASPFLGDRNHMHHLLLDAGFPVSMVTAIITGATLFFGIAAILATKAHAPAVMFSLMFMLMWISFLLATTRRDRSVERFAIVARWGAGLIAKLRPLRASRANWAAPVSLTAVVVDSQPTNKG